MRADPVNATDPSGLEEKDDNLDILVDGKRIKKQEAIEEPLDFGPSFAVLDFIKRPGPGTSNGPFGDGSGVGALRLVEVQETQMLQSDTRTIPILDIEIDACLYEVGKAALESTPLGLLGGVIGGAIENQLDHPGAAGTVDYVDDAGRQVRKSLAGPTRFQSLVSGTSKLARANAIGLTVGAALAGGVAYFTSDACK